MEGFSYVIYSAALLLALGTLLGVLVIVLRKILALLASFTFAGFYALEGLLPHLKFRIPKDGTKRLIMECCGACCTSFTSSIIYFIIDDISQNKPFEYMLLKISKGIPMSFAVFICLCAGGMLAISHFTKEENEDKEWFDKLMTLKFNKKIID